jgi:hypothetical protein
LPAAVPWIIPSAGERIRSIRTHDESFVFARPKRRGKEFGSGLPLEGKFVAYASTAVNEKCNIQGQIRLGAEIRDILRLVAEKNPSS